MADDDWPGEDELSRRRTAAWLDNAGGPKMSSLDLVRAVDKLDVPGLPGLTYAERQALRALHDKYRPCQWAARREACERHVNGCDGVACWPGLDGSGYWNTCKEFRQLPIDAYMPGGSEFGKYPCD